MDQLERLERQLNIVRSTGRFLREQISKYERLLKENTSDESKILNKINDIERR